MGDYRTTAGEGPPQTRRQKRRRRLLFAAFLLTVIAGVTMAGFTIEVDRYVVAAGYVTSELYAEVRPSDTGVVAKIHVESGEYVEEGALLVQLDNSEQAAAFEEAKSRVNQTEAELARRRAEIAEKKRALREDIKVATLRLQNAATKLTRTQELVKKGLVAGNKLDDDGLAQALAQAELTSLMSRDESIFDKELDVLEQELEARGDAVTRIESKLRGKEIRAPISGQVLGYEFVIGELVRPDNVLYEIFGGARQILRLKIAERHAGRIAVGQDYSAKLAPFDHVYFAGKIESLRNIIQGEGQKTFRVAYCSFDPGEYVVMPQTSADARIYYGRSCFWKFLFGID